MSVSAAARSRDSSHLTRLQWSYAAAAAVVTSGFYITQAAWPQPLSIDRQS